MPKLIGNKETVVDIDGFCVTELAGNSAAQDDGLSVAIVQITKPKAEPWLSIDFEERLCVQKGEMILYYDEDREAGGGEAKRLRIKEGETCLVDKGERFRPVFPVAPTEYITICTPAFKPERCIREENNDESEDDIKMLLDKAKKGDSTSTTTTPTPLPQMSCGVAEEDRDPDILYHMCEKHLWDAAVESQKAYYPPTFEQDGFFTHATAVPQRLVDTANHFYQSSTEDWICLQLSRSALTNVGIITKDEGGLPVGDTPASDQILANQWVCPHIYGGIPTLESLKILTKTFPMVRNEKGEFLNIVGLTD